jgi:hypothetical protein
MRLERSVNGAIAGALAAAAWAAIQPLDKQLFRSGYDDLELLGKAVTRERWWPAAGLGLHLANGAAFGAVYAHGRPFIPGPPVARGLLAALAENFATWPLTALTDRYHPARDELPQLSGDARTLAQRTFRHALFGVVLGELERRLNSEQDDEPPPVPVSSNGHGNIEAAVGAT